LPVSVFDWAFLIYTMDRKVVFNKFNGHCAFCGNPLLKGWHVWDIIPIQSVVTESGNIEKVNTENDNLMPACKECGSVRIKSHSGKMDIEQFRKEIIEMYLFCRNDATYSSSIRRAIRFGLIVETGSNIKFHFERFGSYCN